MTFTFPAGCQPYGKECRRKINTKLFVRAGISKKPELLLENIENGGVEGALPIKNVYAWSFWALMQRMR